MARTTKHLTNTEIGQAKAKDKEYNLADGGGLSLRIKPNGKKSWLFNYSHLNSKKRINIGAEHLSFKPVYWITRNHFVLMDGYRYILRWIEKGCHKSVEHIKSLCPLILRLWFCLGYWVYKISDPMMHLIAERVKRDREGAWNSSNIMNEKCEKKYTEDTN